MSLKYNQVQKTALYSLLFLLFNLSSISAQDDPFIISLEPLEIEELGGIQSYAFGQYEGKWIIVGGRLDGLHRRQPWASFDIAGHNDQIWVVDPVNGQKWTSDLSTLSIPLQEQLSSTNMEFYQEGSYLYCMGGYGYSPRLSDHTTYPYLTAIDIPGLIEAIINQNPIDMYFRQIEDPELQVTGGKLKKIEDEFYLLGGQLFIGRYNPMGPDHGPGFIQEYTNSVKVFKIIDDGISLEVEHDRQFTDTTDLHRRDYNAEAQIMPDGNQGITMFSGVFQPDVDLPWLNCIDVSTESYSIINDFEQYFNHYHCPVLPLYSNSLNEMYTLFFGGIAQFYVENDIRVQDNNVPFVKTISCVSRNAEGFMQEEILSAEMPAYLGAGAEFIPNVELPQYSNHVLKLDEFKDDKTHVGYIFGGINSTEANIFFSNNGTQSEASRQIFKVFLSKASTSDTEEPAIEQHSLVQPRIFPNPSSKSIKIDLTLNKKDDVSVFVKDMTGRQITSQIFIQMPKGKHVVELDTIAFGNGTIYLVEINVGANKFVEKLIID